MAIFRGNGGSVEGITESDTVVIAISQGGTGATTASGARSNLGLGTAATTNSTAYATAAQGALADSAVQPGDLGTVATSNDYEDLDNLPTLGTAAATDATDYATAAQGSLADSAVQPGDLATVATSGSYNDLTNKPTVPTDLNSLTDVVITSATTNQILQYNGTNWVNATGGGGSGTVTSVDMSVPTGLAVSGNPITSSGTLAVTYASGYTIPTTSSQTNWDTAYTDRLKWDGGSTGLTASTGRTSLGATTVGSNLFTLTDPSAVTFPRFNADNTVSSLTASDFRIAISAGTVTSVDLTAGTGISVSGGPVTSSGSITVTNSAPMTYPGSGIAVSTGSAWGTSKTSPIGDIVGTSDTQTLTNKTINASQLVDASITAAKLDGAQSGSAPIYAARAWVNFNGSGTVAIRASNNVTSITDNGTGDYTINITTALSDANYAAVGSAENGRILQNNTSRTNTTTAVNVITRNVADANGDSSVVAVSVFR